MVKVIFGYPVVHIGVHKLICLFLAEALGELIDNLHMVCNAVLVGFNAVIRSEPVLPDEPGAEVHALELYFFAPLVINLHALCGEKILLGKGGGFLVLRRCFFLCKGKGADGENHQNGKEERK